MAAPKAKMNMAVWTMKRERTLLSEQYIFFLLHLNDNDRDWVKKKFSFFFQTIPEQTRLLFIRNPEEAQSCQRVVKRENPYEIDFVARSFRFICTTYMHTHI